MIKNRKEKVDNYSKTSIVLHWLLAGLIFIQLSIGLDMVGIPKGLDGKRAFWFTLHKSLGICIAALVVYRLLWRVRNGVPEPLNSMRPWEQLLSSTNHCLLYFCMVLMPLSGILGSLFSKYPLKFFGVLLPKLIDYNILIKELLSQVHQVTSYLFIFLISIHVLAALKHLFIDCDGVFGRMMFRVNQKSNKTKV
jgi:cytochrome b561